jgi:ERO1-like protein beta
VSWGDAFPMCGNRACAVSTLEEVRPPDLSAYTVLTRKEEIPEVWRASVLGQVEGPIATHPMVSQKAKPQTTAPFRGALGHDTAEMCVYDSGYDSERDYCIPEDESNKAGGVYVSLPNNPERFTGYAGDHAHAVWREIYRENCFELQPQDEDEVAMVEKGRESQRDAKNDLEAVMMGRDGRTGGATLEAEYDRMRLENTCLEKRVFWRIISGMHTSISAHLCWDYLNQSTGEWVHHPFGVILTTGSQFGVLPV